MENKKYHSGIRGCHCPWDALPAACGATGEGYLNPGTLDGAAPSGLAKSRHLTQAFYTS